MENIDFFNFENKDRDFPAYNNNPSISIVGWAVLLLLIIPGFIVSMGNSLITGILGCLILGVPLLYFLKWDYALLFQKPSKRDMLLAVGLCIGYLIYCQLITGMVNSIAPIQAPSSSTPTLMTLPPLIFSLMAEELLKLIPFLFILRVAYKFTDNRKLSIVISSIFVMVFFALIHSFSWELFIVAIFFQGFGSIFELFGYIKTKNVLVPYITHLCTDVFVYIPVILHFQFGLL